MMVTKYEYWKMKIQKGTKQNIKVKKDLKNSKKIQTNGVVIKDSSFKINFIICIMH
jgi:hypothetical protein